MIFTMLLQSNTVNWRLVGSGPQAADSKLLQSNTVNSMLPRRRRPKGTLLQSNTVNWRPLRYRRLTVCCSRATPSTGGYSVVGGRKVRCFKATSSSEGYPAAGGREVRCFRATPSIGGYPVPSKQHHQLEATPLRAAERYVASKQHRQ